MKSIIYVLMIALLIPVSGKALHIIGGEISYNCQGNNKYQIVLKVYRDCFSSGAQFDHPASIFIFNPNGTLKQELLASPVITNIPVVIDNPCLVAPPNVCVEEGVYVTTVNLPPQAGGYYLVYQRCCRNTTIANLVNPGSQGGTYIEHIPDPSVVTCNSSPSFNNFPPVAICANEPLNFDHSATDPDGDSLVYNLCSPFQGASQNDPKPGAFSVTPPPYPNVVFSPPYSATNPLGGSPPLSINPATGLLTGTPTTIGQFVVGVCVEEYRNGVLIGTHFRDFQFNVANCNQNVVADIPITPPDTAIYGCGSFSIVFGNNSTGASKYLWDFGDPSTTLDTSSQQYPVYTYPDTGLYKVMLIANPGVACSDTDEVYVFIYPGLKADFEADIQCSYDSLSFTDKTVNPFGSIISWNWNFGDGGGSSIQHPMHLYGQNGTFSVSLSVETSVGCKETEVKQITPHPVPTADFTHDFPCLQKLLVFNNTTQTHNGILANYAWDYGNGQQSTDSNGVTTFTNPGSYTVQLIVETDEGCLDTISKMLNIDAPPLASAFGDTVVCAFEPIQLTASGGLYYQWSPANYLSNPASATPVARPEKDVIYTVTVSDNCYFDTAHVVVDVNPLPDVVACEDTFIYRRDQAFLTAVGTGIHYEWTPQNSLSDPYHTETWASPENTTEYTITTIDQNTCRKSDKVTVYVRDVCYKVIAPNAFSPNSDGLNDVFEIYNFGDGDVERFSIYNRWGQKLFETSGAPPYIWDGVYNGDVQPVGVYAYELILNCGGDAIMYSGNVTLLE